MTHFRLLVLILILLSSCAFATHGQESNSQARNQADKALREKALDLLESLAGQLGILQSPENRARLGANIAESLWERDERRARTLLVSVQNDINTGAQNQSGDEFALQRRMVFLQLRVNTVERIAKHDGELALAFFKATEAPPDVRRPANEDAFRVDTERALEVRLARQVAANNPKVALDLARDSLAKGFSSDLLPLLRRLNRKHPEQASTLYSEIVAKLKGVNLLRDQNAFYFGQNLARSFPPPAADDATFRELMQMFMNLAAVTGCGVKMPDDAGKQYICYQIRSLAPLMARVDPARAATFGNIDEAQTYYPWYEELNDIAEDGSVDDILALATKYPHGAEQIYWRAIKKAQASGDIERARKIANDYNGDPRAKKNFLDFVERLDKVTAIRIEELKDLQAKLDAISGIAPKVALLLRAATIVAQNDQKEAQKLRDQANGLIETMRPGKDQLRLQMSLALAYCSGKNDRGLGIMESLIPKLNELVDAAAKLDGYENQHLRDGEWNMSNEGALGSLLTGLAEIAAYFAWCDFDRAVSLAGQFERPEIRLMAQVKLAQGILAGRPKPIQ